MSSVIYLHASSNDCSDYFPNNNASIFRVKLNKPLNLNGVWKIGICEIDVNSDISERVCVECSLCGDGLIVDGKQTRVLRTFTLNQNYHEIYPILFYVPIETRFVDSIEFRLVKPDGTPILFRDKSAAVHMTLQLMSTCL